MNYRAHWPWYVLRLFACQKKTWVRWGEAHFYCSVEQGCLQYCWAALFWSPDFFCLSYQNSPLTFMLLSVRISTASLTLLICLTWWGSHVFFPTLIIFSIKVTEIHSPISNLALNERQWNPWMKGCSAFSHAVPPPEGYNLCLRWSSVSLLRLPEPWLKPTSLLQL